MLHEPLTVSIGAIDASLPRVSSEKNSATYRDRNFVDTEEKQISSEIVISHNYAKRTRTVVRHNVVKSAIGTVTTVPVTMSAYLVIDTPLSGFSMTEIAENVGGLLSVIGTENNGAVAASNDLKKIIEGES